MNPGQIVALDAMASEWLVAGVIRDARRRQRRRRLSAGVVIATGVAVVAVFFSSGGGREPGGHPGAPGLTTASVSGGRVIASSGVSVRLPAGWVGKAAVLPQGGGNALAWIQATNFPTSHPVQGEDPVKA